MINTKFLKDCLPLSFKNFYREIKKNILPIDRTFPVVQIYINDGEIESTAGINNFISFLNANVKSQGNLKIKIMDKNGINLIDDNFSLNHFESHFHHRIHIIMKTNHINQYLQMKKTIFYLAIYLIFDEI